MQTVSLTESPPFQTLLAWAKAMAKAQGHTTLDCMHFLQAAHRMLPLDAWNDPPEWLKTLDTVAPRSGLPQVDAPVVGEKMGLSDALKSALALGSQDSLEAWLQRLLGLVATPAPKAADHSAPEVDDGVLQTLKPWLLAAMQHRDEAHLTTESLAHAVLAALGGKALDAHLNFKHLCHGHSDELQFWLEHRQQSLAPLQAKAETTAVIALADSMHTALAKVHQDEHAPAPVWRWLQAAVSEANRYSRELQVAYHEAGHAVALHVLAPEMNVQKITITSEGKAAGHVAPDMNEDFRSVYGNSLEFLKERVVICMAGRATEEKRFGKNRCDAGALSDIATANHCAWMGITMFGLDAEFGPINLHAAQKASEKFEDKAPITDMAPTGWLQDLAQKRLHTWMNWGMAQARLLVEAHWPQIEQLTQALMHRKTMNNAEVRALLGAGDTGFRLAEIPGLSA